MTPDSYARQPGGKSTSGSKRSGTSNSHSTSANPTETVGFHDLGLNKQICSALSKSRYTQPTPIQHTAIPLVLQGKDLLGCARTGTGKTAAFALPILQMMMEGDDRRAQDGEPRGRHHKPWIRCLVLAPTRELAAQIHENFEKYAANADLRSLVVFGGVGKHPQIHALQRGVDILVATPGRLLDLHQQGYIDLGDVEYYVLDEADRMLDMGFIHDVRRITNLIPNDRQTLLFSATMPKEIQKLAGSILYEPVKVAVDPVSSTNKPTRQSVYFVDKAHKVDLLVDLLAAPEMQSVLVFTRTKHGADKVARKLVRAGIQASAIHGNKSQGARERTLAGIKAGKIRVVVATDIAARGIDVKGLTHVINFELPNVPEDYVHRVGRTGRAGKTGIAIALCASEEHEYLRDIEKLTKQRLEVLRSRFEQTASAGGRAAALAGRRAEKRGRPTRTPIRRSATGRASTRRARGKSGGRSRRPAGSASTR
ncbi:MAG: DEAD/DEAH box helicase [Planctomycetota bacterium]|nr:DEAD/DEAH box helicase [Planctomycetota bacterium]